MLTLYPSRNTNNGVRREEGGGENGGAKGTRISRLRLNSTLSQLRELSVMLTAALKGRTFLPEIDDRNGMVKTNFNTSKKGLE